MTKLKDYIIYYMPAIISGILISISFPRFDISFIAWFALVPLLLFLHNRDIKNSFIAGFITGIIYFFVTTYWIYHSINHYGSIPFLGSILLVLLLSSYLAIYIGIFAFLYSFKMRKTSIPSVIIAPLIWTSLEYARSYLLSGFPWSSLGYSQHNFLTFIQMSDITGVYGVSFILVAFNGALADFLLIKKRKTERPLMQLYPTVISLSLFALSLLMVFVYGFYRLSIDNSEKTVRAAIIQGSIEQDKKWDPKFQRYVMEIYKELTSKAVKEGVDLIVWPETALPFYYGRDSRLTDELLSFQKGTGAYLITGSMMIKENKDVSKQERFYYTNSAILFDKGANISYIYDKIHLVPFGEYVPMRNILFFIKKLTYGIGDYTPGDSNIKAITPFGSFGTVICYEIIFPGLVRKFFIKGGDFLINITNDAWFGLTSGPYQHFSMSVFRAIENRKPVIRAANSGISGFIDSKGIVTSSSRLFDRTYIISTIKTDSTVTFYSKYGDIFSYFAIVLSIILLLKKDISGGK